MLKRTNTRIFLTIILTTAFLGVVDAKQQENIDTRQQNTTNVNPDIQYWASIGLCSLVIITIMIKANLKDKWAIQLTSTTVYSMCGLIMGFIIIIIMSLSGTPEQHDVTVRAINTKSSGFITTLMRFVFIGNSFCIMIHYKHKNSIDEWLYFQILENIVNISLLYGVLKLIIDNFHIASNDQVFNVTGSAFFIALMMYQSDPSGFYGYNRIIARDHEFSHLLMNSLKFRFLSGIQFIEAIIKNIQYKDGYHKSHPKEAQLKDYFWFCVTLACSAPIGMLMGVLVCWFSKFNKTLNSFPLYMMIGLLFVCSIVFALSHLSITNPIILSQTFGFFLGNYAKFNWSSTTRLHMDNLFKTLHYIIKAALMTILPILDLLHVYQTNIGYFDCWAISLIMTGGMFIILMVSHLLIALLTSCCKFKKPIYHMTFDQRMIWVLSKMSFDLYSALVIRFIGEIFCKYGEHLAMLSIYNMILISNLFISPLLVWFSHRYSRKMDEHLEKFPPEHLKQYCDKLDWIQKQDKNFLSPCLIRDYKNRLEEVDKLMIEHNGQVDNQFYVYAKDKIEQGAKKDTVEGTTEDNKQALKFYSTLDKKA